MFDDVRTDPDVYNPKTPIRSEIIVPLGDHGIIIVGDTQSAAFDEQAVELVEILGATATAALEQVEREQELRYRERQLTQRTKQLEEVESINTQIRNVTRTIVQANTRQEVFQAVCAELVETDSVEFAWIGTVDPVDNALVSQAQAGDDWGYLDGISTSLADTGGSEPAVQAAQTQERVLVSNTATDMTQEPWRKEAVKRDFKSVMSIPLLHQETLQGVLTIYADSQTAFSGLVESVLSELGDLLAHGIVAIGRRQALLSNQGTELDFRIQDPACLFLRFAQETDSSLSVEGIIPQPDESSLVFVRVDGDVEQFIETAEQTPAVKTARLIETDGSALIQLRFVRPFIASILADQGITVHDITAEGSDCRVTVSVPPTFDIRQTVKTITTQYSDSELLAKREQSHPSGIAGNLTNRVLDELTPRQREVVEVAYFRGFFDSPREATGKEIAEELDISSTAFHQHVRSAEQKLFRAIFENGMSSSSGSTGNPLFG